MTQLTINGVPCNHILRPIVDLLGDMTPTEVEGYVLDNYDEPWFSTKTPSLRGNDNRLNHRIRSLRSLLSNWYLLITH